MLRISEGPAFGLAFWEHPNYLNLVSKSLTDSVIPHLPVVKCSFHCIALLVPEATNTVLVKTDKLAMITVTAIALVVI